MRICRFSNGGGANLLSRLLNAIITLIVTSSVCKDVICVIFFSDNYRK